MDEHEWNILKFFAWKQSRVILYYTLLSKHYKKNLPFRYLNTHEFLNTKPNNGCPNNSLKIFPVKFPRIVFFYRESR